MRAAPLKGDCLVCQAPDEVRFAVNAAIWHGEDVIRAADYARGGARAGAQAATTSADPKAVRYREPLDRRTITRHADHIEEDWRDINPGERLREREEPVASGFGDVTDAAAQLGMMAMGGMRDLIAPDPARFAALFPKETIAIAKLGLGGAVAKEGSRLKRNQQAIDVMAIFAGSAGFAPQADPDDIVEGEIVDMKAAVAAERLLLAEPA